MARPLVDLPVAAPWNDSMPVPALITLALPLAKSLPLTSSSCSVTRPVVMTREGWRRGPRLPRVPSPRFQQ